MVSYSESMLKSWFHCFKQWRYFFETIWMLFFRLQPIEILKPFFILITVKILTISKLENPQIKYFLSFTLLSSIDSSDGKLSFLSLLFRSSIMNTIIERVLPLRRIIKTIPFKCVERVDHLQPTLIHYSTTILHFSSPSQKQLVK